ncbi:MAG: VacJ family lipoprotein, partial [Deltaproteobacteria bacterium]|nr:VacJ family lipoprotein [Deltaproteobacteria bacterium]
IFGPSSLRDSATFIDTLLLDPVSWMASNRQGNLDFWALVAVRAGILFNELSFQIDDIDALKEAVLDPYIAVRDAYVERRAKLVAE